MVLNVFGRATAQTQSETQSTIRKARKHNQEDQPNTIRRTKNTIKNAEGHKTQSEHNQGRN